MKRINYNNNISYYTDVLEINNLHSVECFGNKKSILGQDNIFETNFNIGKNDTNLLNKTDFYKNILFRYRSFLIEKKMSGGNGRKWISLENHFIQDPGTKDPQFINRIADLGENRIVMLFFINSNEHGGSIIFPKQNLSFFPQANSLLLFPSGEEYAYNLQKLGGIESKKFIEMVIY